MKKKEDDSESKIRRGIGGLVTGRYNGWKGKMERMREGRER